MKIVGIIARILLGLAFVVFGLNGFLHFIPNGPMPAGPAGQFIAAMMASHYIEVVAALEVIGGAMLLAGQFVPLGLTLLGPIVVNILLFHLLMERTGLPVAALIVVLWLVVFSRVSKAFSGLFLQKLPS